MARQSQLPAVPEFEGAVAAAPPPPLASSWPSRLKARACTQPLWPARVRRQTPVTAFHRWIWWSAPPLASSSGIGVGESPGGQRPAIAPSFHAPARVRRHVPRANIPQPLTVLSPLRRLARVWPSGLKAIRKTPRGRGRSGGFSPAHRPPPSNEANALVGSAAGELSGHRGCRPPPAPSCHAPRPTNKSCPVWLSHTRTWQSVSPVASHWPLGLKAAASTLPSDSVNTQWARSAPAKLTPCSFHVLQVGLPHRQP